MNISSFPTSQKELLIAARGGQSQTAFARTLGVDRSCLSRYESEKLGAPTEVLNFCLRRISDQIRLGNGSELEQALQLMRRATNVMEKVVRQGEQVSKPSVAD